MPFHDADVHGGGRLWHRRSLPLRRVALDAAALHRLQEPKAAARSAWGAGNPPKGQHRPHSPSPCPPLGVTQLKVSRGKRERARSPGWAPVFAARIPRSARLLPHFPRQGGSRPAPQPHHFLHPVKLRRWPRSHVHMVRNACGKLKKKNKKQTAGYYGVLRAAFRQPGRQCTARRRSSACMMENPTPTFVSLQFAVFQHKSGAAASLHDPPPLLDAFNLPEKLLSSEPGL